MQSNTEYNNHEDEIQSILINQENSETEIIIKEEWNSDKNFEENVEKDSDKESSDWLNFENEKDKPYKCEKCEKAFEFNKELLLHIQIIHEKKKPFECGQCKKSFENEDSIFLKLCIKCNIGTYGPLYFKRQKEINQGIIARYPHRMIFLVLGLTKTSHDL